MNRTRTSNLNSFGLRDQRNQIYPALSASDGSTINLDFTMMGGALDSRFTFSRTSNATYINSSGYVAWNNSNLFYNTAWTSTSLPAGWGEGISVAATFTYNGNGTITCSAASGRAVLIPASPYTATLTGVPFTISFTVTAVSGSPTLADVITTNAGTDTFTVNGIARTNSQVLVADDYVTCTSTATSTAHVPRIGIGVLGALASTKSVTIKDPQANIGSTAQPYTPNTSTSTGYYAPRFDYNPTTLAPKGLLIESAATNLSTYSADFSNAAWTKQNSSITTAATTSPENDLTGSLSAENVITFGKHGIERSVAITAGSIYTFSVFLKEPTTDSRRYVAVQVADGQAVAARFTANFDLQLGTVAVSASTNGTAGAPTDTNSSITAYPNGWYKCSVTMKHVASPSYPVVLLNNLATLPGLGDQPNYSASSPYKGIYVWGAQLELGKGASSYIPTVASQVTKAIDSCTFAVTPANIGLTSTPPATFCYSANVHAISTAGFPTIIAFQDSGNTTAVFRSQINSTTSNYVTWLPTGVASNQANEITYTTVSQGVSFKVASSITSTFVTASRNGVAATAVAVGATYSFVTPDKIVIGILASNVAFTIANFKFFPIEKSQTELNALTT